MINKSVVNIIGSGYAGIEAALFLAGHGVKVHVFSKGEKHKSPPRIGDRTNTLSGEIYEKLLTKELCLLGSPLARKKQQLDQEQTACVDPLLKSFALNMLYNNENIEVFNASMAEISPHEITIIATGQHTDDRMFDYLISKYGTMKCVKSLPQFPVVEGIEDVFVFERGENEFLISLMQQEYDSFVDEIVSQVMEEKRNNPEFKIHQNTIEELALHYKENLRSYSMMPQRIYEGIKPYATLIMKRKNDGFELQNISSSLPEYRQEAIFKKINALRNCKIVKEAGVIEGRFVNPVHIANEFGQSWLEKNVFFAGGIMGIGGHVNSIASGLWTALNVYKLLKGQQMVKMPTACAFGKFVSKVSNGGPSKIRPLLTNDDFINVEHIVDSTTYIDESFELSVRALEIFKEEYKNGKYV